MLHSLYVLTHEWCVSDVSLPLANPLANISILSLICICFSSSYKLNLHVSYSNNMQEIEKIILGKMLTLRPSEWRLCVTCNKTGWWYCIEILWRELWTCWINIILYYITFILLYVMLFNKIYVTYFFSPHLFLSTFPCRYI